MERPPLSNPLTRTLAWATGRLIMRSLRRQFRAVRLRERGRPDPGRSIIVFANHHYWWDGYLVHLLQQHWGFGTVMVWMREWRRFPPFGSLGAMPFPDDDMKTRIATIRQTLRTLKNTPSMLFLFPERDLHSAPTLLPFHRSLFWLHRQLDEIPLLPVAIQVVAGIHQYPEVFIATNRHFCCEESDEKAWLECARSEIAGLLGDLDRLQRSSPESFRRILDGRQSANERWRCSGRPPSQPK